MAAKGRGAKLLCVGIVMLAVGGSCWAVAGDDGWRLAGVGLELVGIIHIAVGAWFLVAGTRKPD